MPSTTVEPAESSTDHHHGSASRASQLHVPALRQLYGRVSARGRPKSTASESSLSSRPVVVRTYSPASRSRAPASRSPSSAREPRNSAYSSTGSSSSTMPASLPPSLPSTTDFSFDGILHAVEPEINSAIDAIAAICARSKLCLADEYAAHRPPHEVFDPAIPLPQSQRQRWWSVVRDTALAAVPEASSSSERLTSSRSASHASISSIDGHSVKDKKSSAYENLKSFVSGDGSERRRGLASLFGVGAAGCGDESSSSNFAHHAQWMVSDDGNGCIRLLPRSTARAASPRVSLAITEEPISADGASAAASRNDATTWLVRPSSSATGPLSRYRNRSRSSPGWLSWGTPRHGDIGHSHPCHLPAGATVAEQRLKWLLEPSALRAARVKQCDYRMIPA